MTFYKTLLVWAYSILLSSIYAHVYPVDFNTQGEQSSKIIIAQVIAKYAYWTAYEKEVYTNYAKKVICYTQNPTNLYFFDFILQELQSNPTPSATLQPHIDIIHQEAILDIHKVLQEWERNQEVHTGNWSQSTDC